MRAGVVGIVCVGRGLLRIATLARWRTFANPQAWTGVGWGRTIAFLIACYALADAHSVKSLGMAPVVLDWMAGLGITVMMAPGAWVRRRDLINRMRGHWRPALVVGVLSPAGYILVLYALRHGAPVSLVAPLRETSLMLATLAGYFILKERISPAR